MTEKYFDVAIYKNSFCIIESSFKPHSYDSAHVTLKKIEFIVKNKLTYDTNHQHQYSSLSRYEIADVLQEKSLQICKGYQEKQSKLNWVARKLFSKEKQISIIYTSIVNYIEPSRLLPLPIDVIYEIAKHLDISNLGTLAKLNRHGNTHAKITFIIRAKKYGYEGNNYTEACKYIVRLKKEINYFVKLDLIPKKWLAYKSDKIDPEKIIETLYKLNFEDLNDFFLTADVFIISSELRSKVKNLKPLYTVEFNNIHKLLLLILNKHLSTSPKKDIDKCSATGSTILMKAALAGKTEFVKLLLEHNADISIFNQKGNNALILAAYLGNKY